MRDEGAVAQYARVTLSEETNKAVFRVAARNQLGWSQHTEEILDVDVGGGK